jgi:aldehyde dehydrogenase (NAD+)
MELLSKLHIELMNEGACYGAEGWLPNPGAQPYPVVNPATEETIAHVRRASQAAYQTIVEKAQSAFLAWREIPAPQRGDIVQQIGNRLRENKTELGQLITLETGKILEEGYGEVQEMIDMAEFAVGQSRMLYGKTMQSERAHHRMYEQWHPLGIVGIITAFNFPGAVWAWNAFTAVIAGNSVIWKPSSQAPLFAIAIQHICNEVLAENHCPPIFSLFLPESSELLNQFVEDSRIQLVSFTGSTETGRSVATRVAARLGKSLLELGGNNAIIIDETANFDLALRAIVFAAVGTAGQRCTSTRRLFIQDSIFGVFIDRLIHAYQQIRIGDPSDQRTLMGPLINQGAVHTYKTAIEEIKACGGNILYGGHVLPGPGYYVEPTLVKAEHHWPIIQRETFAPILYLIPFETFEESLVWNNEVSHGLSSALFTNHLQRAEQFLSATGSDCGIANINLGTSGAEIGGAFGGEKDTGGGREAGSDAWKAYMRRQTTTINWGHTLPLAQGIEFMAGDI